MTNAGGRDEDVLGPEDLERALARSEFRVGYQPQVHLDTGEVVGVEALLRWKGRSLAELMPIAEESGLIVPIGDWVLDQALCQLAAWDRAGVGRLHMSVNLSGAQLNDDFAPAVRRTLTRHGLAPERLSLELTETTLMTSGRNVAGLYELHGMGVYLSIDDFGTGYSSLAYLRQLPVDVVKIDKSFISGPDDGFIDRPVVESVMSLAAAMGLHVVAEGVESDVQACELIAVGCPVGQGFLFAPATEATRVPDLVRALYDPKEWCKAHPFEGGRGRQRAQMSIVDELMYQAGVPQRER